MNKLLTILILLIALTGQSTTYQIADQAAKDAFNFASLAAGDNVLFQRGHKFTGAITISVSGTEGNPITFGAYGTGANPIISGFAQVTAWTNLGSNIWESTSAVSTLSYLNIVTINGVNTPMGRTPNVGSYYTIQSHTANTSITSANLTGTPNWTGAQIVQRKQHWIWQTGNITSQSGSTINYTDVYTGEGLEPKNTWGFFIQNDVRTLDTQNEWYYNPSTKKLRIYSTSQPTNVYVPANDYCITLSGKKYVTIEKLTIIGANNVGIYAELSTDNLIVNNCLINKCGLYGVKMLNWCDDYAITNNVVKNCNYSGIHSYGYLNTNETITNNTLDSCNMIIGIGEYYAPAAIMSYASPSLIQYNIVDHSGYNGIMKAGEYGEVRNNLITNSLLTTNDGGGIYTAGSHLNMIIDGNIVSNTFGNYAGAGTGGNYPIANGIYLDVNSSYTTVSNNTCFDNGSNGIYLNYGTDHNTITNNTSFNNTSSQFQISNITDDPTGVNNNQVINNVFVARQSSQKVASFYSKTTGIIPSFFSSINNNVYARPIDDSDSFLIYEGIGLGENKTLAQWKTFSGKDANSTKSPKAITSESDIEIRYNATSSPVQVSFPWAGISMTGVQYASNPTIPAYSSLVLIKNIPNPTGNKKAWGSNNKIWGKNGVPWGAIPPN